MYDISFVIPVYNCGTYLNSCIENIQTEFINTSEIILINDGSTDNSGSVCDKLCRKFENIKVFHQKNQGVSIARNRGIEEASGRFIIFVDADDSIVISELRELISVMKTNNAIDLLIYGIAFDFYKNKKKYRSDLLVYPNTGILDPDKWMEQLFKLYRYNALSPVWNKIYCRNILMEKQIRFNTEMFLYEDLDFSLRYIAHCENIYCSKKIVYHYRQAEDEGNAKRRLLRIEHLTSLIDQINSSLNMLLESKHYEEKTYKQKTAVLINLYMILAREKIAAADRSQISVVCEDMKNWIEKQDRDAHTFLSDRDREYLQMILKKQIGKLILNREYINIRHKAAVRIKSSMLYHKAKKS